MSDSPIQNVSDTAFLVAAYRAAETERPAPLFRDPLAERLGGPKGREIIAGLPKKALAGGWSVVIRTCIIDRFLQAAIAEGVDTVLNLGAGLDTRPYRLELPAELRWVEVDFRDVIQLKEAKLAGEKPRCHLDRIVTDLSDARQRRALLAELAARSRKVLVLTEGVIPYLTEAEVASLASDLRALPSFRYWIADYFSAAAYEYRRRQGMTKAMKYAPFRFEPVDYFGFFLRQGWKPRTIRYLGEEGERLHRPFPMHWALRLWVRLITALAPAEKAAALKQFAGYVWFEPA